MKAFQNCLWQENSSSKASKVFWGLFSVNPMIIVQTQIGSVPRLRKKAISGLMSFSLALTTWQCACFADLRPNPNKQDAKLLGPNPIPSQGQDRIRGFEKIKVVYWPILMIIFPGCCVYLWAISVSFLIVVSSFNRLRVLPWQLTAFCQVWRSAASIIFIYRTRKQDSTGWVQGPVSCVLHACHGHRSIGYLDECWSLMKTEHISLCLLFDLESQVLWDHTTQ